MNVIGVLIVSDAVTERHSVEITLSIFKRYNLNIRKKLNSRNRNRKIYGTFSFLQIYNNERVPFNYLKYSMFVMKEYDTR